MPRDHHRLVEAGVVHELAAELDLPSLLNRRRGGDIHFGADQRVGAAMELDEAVAAAGKDRGSLDQVGRRPPFICRLPNLMIVEYAKDNRRL